MMRLITLITFIVSFCIACSQSREPMTILAGSELKDLQPLLGSIHSCANVELDFTYVGTLDGAEQLAGGAEYDLAWFSHAKYMNLLEQTNKRIVIQEKIMLSPVVMGIKADKIKAFGWDTNKVTWRDIAAKSAAGELSYAMTNPASSNSGFTALFGAASALSDNQNEFDPSSIDNSALKDFFKGQALTAGSSGWLADAYIREQNQLDGMINYESVLMQLNASGRLTEPLTLLYPKEGIITADYPLMLLNKEKREAYDQLVNCLRSADIQSQIMSQTSRRPAIKEVKLSSDFADNLLIELPFPRTLSDVDNLLFAYLDKHRKLSHTFFVLDVSGSMQGESIMQLKDALNNLTGVDNSLTGQFARFRARETISMLPFNDQPLPVSDFTITNTDKNSPEMTQLRDYINYLQPDGGTAIYSSLSEAYRQVEVAISNDPEKYYTVVLLTDGQNQQGIDFEEFQNMYRNLPVKVKNVKTFPILFGQSNDDEMEKISELTGGKVFDAKKSSLNSIFNNIRGYQ